ncbi:hypothetical protein L7F22_052033 [Adiantum nelumboides]|nr:hypothetical protein [Adiantum nelumboides]
MARPAYAERVNGKLAPLKIASFHDSPAPADHHLDSAAPGFLPEQLDVLWHFECVVSPRSPASSSLSPRSPSPPNSASPRSVSSSSPSPSPLSRFAPSTPDGHRVLQRVFSTFDENGDGSVSINEIARIFDRLGFSSSEYSIQSLLAGLVTKSSGLLDEEEFLQLYESVCSFVEEFDATAAGSTSSVVDADGDDQDLLAAFHVFDKDGNGFISPSELQSVLCSLGFPQARQLDACIDMIAKVDENGDGQVDFFEFKKLFHLENPFMNSIQSF